jgi:hypothetical protein
VSEWQRLAQECGTDKGTHTYMPVYERFLGRASAGLGRLLEIGVGNGESAALWLKLFPAAEVLGLDYRGARGHPPLADPRVKVFARFQQDPAVSGLFAPHSLDVIIDDGGHRREWQRASRDILWGALKGGGLYFIEDILTDEYPDEVDFWKADPDHVYSEANRHDVHGKYERSDAVVVLKKTRERPAVPLEWRMREPLWPCFFHYMESLAEWPFTGRTSGGPWDWLHALDWRPRYDAFCRGELWGGVPP